MPLQDQCACWIQPVEGLVQHHEHRITEKREQHRQFLLRAERISRDEPVEHPREGERFGQLQHIRIDRGEALRRGIYLQALPSGQQSRQPLRRAAEAEPPLR